MRDLPASEAQVRDHYQAIACAFLVHDSSGRIIDANRAAESILGFSIGEMRGRTPDSLWHPAREDGSNLPPEEAPDAMALRTGRPVRQFIVRITRPDGEYRWLLNDAVPVRVGDAKTVQVVSSFMDVTELKRAHARARAAAQQLELLSERTSDAITTVDLQHRVLSWNQGAERIYGWSPEEVVGQINPAVPPELVEEELRCLERVLETGEAVADYETERLTKDGRRIPVRGTLSPLRDDTGKIVATLGISKDTSARTRLTDLSKQLALLEERERIATDFHDGLIQSLYGLELRLGAVARSVNSSTADPVETLRQMEAQVEGIIQSIHSFMFDLRPYECRPHDPR